MKERPKIAAFDFDATLVEYGTLEPIPGMLPLVRALQKTGWEIVIHTSRRKRRQVRRFLLQKGIEARVYWKPDARVYVDDRAMAFDGNAGAMFRKIVDFKPWYVRLQDGGGDYPRR